MPAPKNTAEMIGVQQRGEIMKKRPLLKLLRYYKLSSTPLYRIMATDKWSTYFTDKVSTVVIYCPGCTWAATMNFLPWDPLSSTNNYYRY